MLVYALELVVRPVPRDGAWNLGQIRCAFAELRPLSASWRSREDLGSTSLDDIMLSVPLAGWKELMLSL